MLSYLLFLSCAVGGVINIAQRTATVARLFLCVVSCLVFSFHCGWPGKERFSLYVQLTSSAPLGWDSCANHMQHRQWHTTAGH